MSWETARVVLTCQRCRAAIAVGQHARRGDVATECTWCEGCAAVEFPTETAATVTPAATDGLNRLRPLLPFDRPGLGELES